MIKKLLNLIYEAIGKMIGYKSITDAFEIDGTGISDEMSNALDVWKSMYKDEKYYFSGCDEVFDYGSLYTNSTLKYANSIMIFDSDGVDTIIIYIPGGVTLSNHTLYPMITLGEKKIQWTPPVGSEKLNDIVTKIKNDLGGLSFSVSGTTLSITDGTNTWTLSQ